MISDYYADEVYKQLYKNTCNFINKTCLDIGTRNGANCVNLVKVGASSVLGIDIDSSHFEEMWVDKKITLLKQDLLTTCLLQFLRIYVYSQCPPTAKF